MTQIPLSRADRRKQQRTKRGRSKPASQHSRRIIDPIKGAQRMADRARLVVQLVVRSALNDQPGATLRERLVPHFRRTEDHRKEGGHR